MRRKPEAFHGTLLAEAWKATWQRKSLWLFGMFAAAVSTGGVFEIGLKTFHRVKKGGEFLEELWRGSIPGFDDWVQYIRLFSLMEPWRQQALLAGFTVLGVLVVVLGVVSQAAIIEQAGDKKPLPVRKLLMRSEHAFWRVLAIDLAAKGLSLAALIAATLPLALFVRSPSLLTGSLYTGAFLVFFPAVIILNLLSVLAVVSVVEHDHGIIKAMEESVNLFRRHWLIMLELGIASFFLSSLILVAAVLGALVLYVLTGAMLMLAVTIGSASLYLWSAVFGSVFMAAAFLLGTGIMTAFQFAVWLQYFRHAKKPGHLVARLEHWWGKIV